MSRSLLPVVVALGAALMAAPVHSAAEPKLPAPTVAKAGTVQGWVVDSTGKPLPGAVVHIYGTTMAGQNTRFEVKVGADGRYRQRVPDGIYGVRAEYVVRAGEQPCTLGLHPLDGITGRNHDAEEGISKDFVWRIAGLRPGETPGEAGTHNEPSKYYGGSLQISAHQEGFATEPPFAAGTILVATLTPEGPLLDGRAGQPLVFRRTFSAQHRSSSYWYPCDIPLGRYTLQLTLEAPGQAARALGLKKSLEFSAPFTATTRVDILPSGTTGAALPVQITVKP